MGRDETVFIHHLTSYMISGATGTNICGESAGQFSGMLDDEERVWCVVGRKHNFLLIREDPYDILPMTSLMVCQLDTG